MHQIRFRLELCPRPHWRACSAPHGPDPVAELGPYTSKGREGREEREREGREEKGEENGNGGP